MEKSRYLFGIIPLETECRRFRVRLQSPGGPVHPQTHVHRQCAMHFPGVLREPSPRVPAGELRRPAERLRVLPEMADIGVGKRIPGVQWIVHVLAEIKVARESA